MLPTASVYAVALLAALLLAWRGIARRTPAWQVAARVLLAVYLGWLIGATLFPLPLHHLAGGGGLGAALNHPNLVPFASIRATLAEQAVWPRVRLLGGNVLVFVPFGLLLPAIWPRLDGFWRMVLAGVAVGVSIELTQLAVSLAVGSWYRMSDVDDVILNTAGVLLGYGLWRALRHRAAQRPQEAATDGRR
jgi:glycopeptide antibiotics resistance protein